MSPPLVHRYQADRYRDVFKGGVGLPISDGKSIMTSARRIVHHNVMRAGRGSVKLHPGKSVEATRSKSLIRRLCRLFSLFYQNTRSFMQLHVAREQPLCCNMGPMSAKLGRNPVLKRPAGVFNPMSIFWPSATSKR